MKGKDVETKDFKSKKISVSLNGVVSIGLYGFIVKNSDYTQGWLTARL